MRRRWRGGLWSQDPLFHSRNIRQVFRGRHSSQPRRRW